MDFIDYDAIQRQPSNGEMADAVCATQKQVQQPLVDNNQQEEQLIDKFAMAALSGIFASLYPKMTLSESYCRHARMAYKLADAMIQVRKEYIHDSNT